jgi:hypothetical protein
LNVYYEPLVGETQAREVGVKLPLSVILLDPVIIDKLSMAWQ